MGTRDEYVKTLKSAAVTLGTNALYSMLVAEVPAFANPILGFIAKEIINEALTKLIDETEFGAFFLYIDVRVDKQGTEFFEAALKNKKAQTSGSEKEKADAEKELKQKFYDFARWAS